MLILGLDTATRATVAALVGSGEGGDPLELEARDDPRPGSRPQHATRLLGLVAEVLDGAGAGWEQVDRIAVGVGPGTFTGMRIGIASARALARARGIDLVGVSTLQSVAFNAAPAATLDRAEAVLAVLDARRGEAFVAGWVADRIADGDGGLISPRVCDPEALAAAVSNLARSTLAVGEGAVEFRAVLERAGALVPGVESELHRVSAIAHCRLAFGMRASSPAQVQPSYLRLPDAEINRRSAADR